MKYETYIIKDELAGITAIYCATNQLIAQAQFIQDYRDDIVDLDLIKVDEVKDLKYTGNKKVYALKL